MKKISRLPLLFSLSLVVLFTTNQFALAKAYFSTLKEMVEKSDSIAIANLGPVKEINDKGKTFDYSKEVQATVLETFKGSLPKQIVIKGGENFICAQVRLIEGKCLLFLSKESDYFKGANWQNSCTLIKGNKVHWYKNVEERFPQEDVELEKAIKDVKSLVGGKGSTTTSLEQSMKLPDYLETLFSTKEFADSIRGEAPKDRVQWTAYTKACRESAKIKKELVYLSEKATPAGKLYAACALMSCDNKLALDFLRKMKDKKDEVLYLSGCRGTTASQGEIATSLLDSGKFLNFKLASKYK